MRKISTLMSYFIFALIAFQSCSSSHEEGILQKYFLAFISNDNSTLSNLAIEPFSGDVVEWEITQIWQERIEAFDFLQLCEHEMLVKKRVDDHGAVMSAIKEALDASQKTLVQAKTNTAKQIAQEKVDMLQGVNDKEIRLHGELQSEYDNIRARREREDKIVALSLQSKDLVNIKDLTGNVCRKEVTVKVKGEAELKDPTKEPRNYKVYLRQYLLRDETLKKDYSGKWVIEKFELLK